MSHWSIGVIVVAALGIGVATYDLSSQGIPSARPSAVHAASTAATLSAHAALPDADANDVVEQYCTGCHSERRRRGDLVLEGFDVAAAVDNGAVVEKMIRKLRAGMRPAAGSRRPEA